MCLCRLAGMECICDILHCEDLMDDDKDVEGQPVLITTHSDIVDNNIIEAQRKCHLGRRHPEEVFETPSLFIHLEVYHPSVICILQLVKLVDDCHKITSQCLHRLAHIALGLVKKVGDLS